MPGIFVGGAFQEPKDIPETVMQASAAAAMAMELLSPAQNTLITSKEYPYDMMLPMKVQGLASLFATVESILRGQLMLKK